MKRFISMMKDESGVTAIEYGLIAALIGVAMILGAQAVGTSLSSKFQTISGSIDSAGN